MSCANFSPTKPNHLYSRQLNTVSLWDIRNHKDPVETLNVTEYIDKNVFSLYEQNKLIEQD
jgi:hypothetical protein